MCSIFLICLSFLGYTSGQKSFEIAPGVFMPAVSLGHPDDNNANETTSLELWLKLGGAGIDTAYDYMNQKEVGKAIRQSGRPRSSLFITTKIPGPVGRQAAVNYVKNDLAQMGIAQADLILIHKPCREGFVNCTAAPDKVILDTWLGLEDVLKLNLTRAIGISNFLAPQMKTILAGGSVVPALNQCALSIGAHDDATRSFCQDNNITYEAYSPLRHVDFTNIQLLAIAKAHQVTPAQVVLRWINQLGCPLATSPDTVSYDQQDLGIFSFTLTAAEINILSSI